MAEKDKAKTPVTPAVVEEKKEPEMVALKDVAKQAGVEPREARAILRKISTRGDDQKRARWQWTPAEAPGVVAKIKTHLAEKAQKAAEAAAAAKEEAPAEK